MSTNRALRTSATIIPQLQTLGHSITVGTADTQTLSAE
jgi:hypothetical protein